MTTFHAPEPFPVDVDRDAEARITYLDAGGIQAAVEDAPADVVALTILLPVDLLRSFRSLLNHPRMAVLLDGPDLPSPPTA